MQARFFVFFSCFFVFCAGYNHFPTCGNNEYAEDCGNGCDPVGCPKSYAEEKARLADCIAPAVCLPTSCRCLPDYRRDRNGNCIYIGKCPGICPMNEEFSSCIQSLNRAQSCPQSGPISSSVDQKTACSSGCVCKEHMLRDQNGNCVPKDQCPVPTCGNNEYVEDCANGCDPVGCPESYAEEKARLADCIAPAVCLPTSCRCLPDYRRDRNGNCIYIGKCPGICPKNEEFSNCTQSLNRAQNCPQSGPINSPVDQNRPCTSGCVCKEHKLRDQNGNCVPKYQCPAPQCGQNEVLSCVYDCPPERTCRTRGIQFRCQEPTKACEEKCVCKPGHYRNVIGECITGKECDKCKGSNEFFSCGNECDNICSELATQNRTNCPIINIVCNPKCYCEDGFARNFNKQCVPIGKCPNINCA